MSEAPRFERYAWAGGEEWMLRFGPNDAPQVIVAQPLFEEANRTRTFAVTILRLLAERGIGGASPDLPGQGESLVPTVDARLEHWRQAFAAATTSIGRPAHVVAIRGGALVDADARAVARLHLSPEPGRTLVRDLLRARRAAALATGTRLVADDIAADGPPLLLAGNLLDRTLLRALMTAEPTPADRVVTIVPGVEPDHLLAPPDDGHPDRRPFHAAPWRTAEPGFDAALAEAFADDIVEWIATCAG